VTPLAPYWNSPIAQAIFWSALTIGSYSAAKTLYQKRQYWWLSPLVATPALLIPAAWLLHTSYADYIRGTHWLLALLGPTTVAFAYRSMSSVRSSVHTGRFWSLVCWWAV
jgi:putative effector of murein hydrolase